MNYKINILILLSFILTNFKFYAEAINTKDIIKDLSDSEIESLIKYPNKAFVKVPDDIKEFILNLKESSYIKEEIENNQSLSKLYKKLESGNLVLKLEYIEKFVSEILIKLKTKFFKKEDVEKVENYFQNIKNYIVDPSALNLKRRRFIQSFDQLVVTGYSQLQQASANSLYSTNINSKNISVENLNVNRLTVNQETVNRFNINTEFIIADRGNITDLTSVNAITNNLNADTANINVINSNNINNSENINTDTISSNNISNSQNITTSSLNSTAGTISTLSSNVGSINTISSNNINNSQHITTNSLSSANATIDNLTAANFNVDQITADTVEAHTLIGEQYIVKEEEHILYNFNVNNGKFTIEGETGQATINPTENTVGLVVNGATGAAGININPQSSSPGLTIGSTTNNAINVNSGAFTVNGNTGNTTVTGTLTVAGATNLSSVSTSGNATIGGNLSVAGAATVNTLSATGAVDFDSTLSVDGHTDMTSLTAENLSVTGAATVNTLNATGAVDFDSTLNVDGHTDMTSLTATTGAINQVSLADGTVSSPALNFQDSTNSGLYRDSTDIGFARSGVQLGVLNGNGGVFTNNHIYQGQNLEVDTSASVGTWTTVTFTNVYNPSNMTNSGALFPSVKGFYQVVVNATPTSVLADLSDGFGLRIMEGNTERSVSSLQGGADRYSVSATAIVFIDPSASNNSISIQIVKLLTAGANPIKVKDIFVNISLVSRVFN